MEIEYLTGSGADERNIAVRHGEQESFWCSKSLSSTEMGKTSVDVFQLLNEYWKRNLSAQEQNELYELYELARITLDGAKAGDALYRELRVIVAKILDNYLSLDKIHHWVVYDSRIQVPSSIQTSLGAEQHFFTEAGTYLKQDYRKLVALAIAMRALIPIWTEFMERGKREFKIKGSKSNYQEFYSYRLIAKSAIYHSEEMEKLRRYVAYNIQSDKKDMVMVIDGVGSEDHVEFILAKIVVRRLAIGDITGMSERGNIVSFISMYIRGIMNRADTNYSDGIRSKDIEERGDEDDKIAFLESYPAHDRVAPTMIAMNRFFATVDNVIRIVEPDIDPKLVEEAVKACEKLEGMECLLPQYTIIQMTLKKAISPRAIPTLLPKQRIAMTAATLAILWHRGWHFFAALVSSFPSDVHDTVRSYNIDVSVPQALNQQLAKYFPYQNRFRSSRTEKIESITEEATRQIIEALVSKEWVTVMPDEWRAQMPEQAKRKVLQIPTKLKSLLVEFIIDCIERNK